MGIYRIHRFSKLTGLTPHVIRAWERRHHLVEPERGKNRYRLYSDDDVALFRYIKGEIDKGQTIGELADIGREKLLGKAKLASLQSIKVESPSEGLLAELIEAVQKNDFVTFEKKLNGAVAVVPFEEALQRFLIPLQVRIGEMWHEGKVNIAQEHYVTSHVQQKLYAAMNHMRVMNQGPVVVVACPPNETHEVGAQAVAYLCLSRGYQTHFLGANLPIDHLASYCQMVQPTLVLLSMTLSPTQTEAETLGQQVSSMIVPLCRVGIGGSGILACQSVFQEKDIMVFSSAWDLEPHLSSLTTQ
ncbi:MAG: MerR family transcriptional regulator [Nitrospirales bacterium]|nr:MerR family transcriptional regulator [Nitrospirales bacterium]